MQHDNERATIEDAIAEIVETSSHSTDGEWLEELAARVAPHIREWDVSAAYRWRDWREREFHFPNSTASDIGIDVVAVRRSDSKHIAIQCKSRKLDERGHGSEIEKRELDSFLSASDNAFWTERWLIVNGDVPLGRNAERALSMSDNRPKHINIHKDLVEGRIAIQSEPDCPHCQLHADDETPRQTKTCMQNEAVAESVRILNEHVRTDSGGLPVGQARGKVILPCGTGKTRISLRIVEELTQTGELAVVLCPSIALVAQIRREYLQHAQVPVRALAVCSDQTAGYNAKRDGIVDTFANPTADNSSVSASEVKGKVTTDSREIADWISEGEDADAVNVVFGTYQSGHRVAEALRLADTTAKVLIADEAHRTAGLRRKKSQSAKAKAEADAIRDFTLCHANDAFPATYRVYQTATPKVFGLKNNASSDWVVRTMDDETVFGVELYRKSYPEAVRSGWLADYRIIALAVNDPEAYKQANLLASGTELTGRRAITSAQYLRGLAFALAMGGATQGGENGDVPINSCIAFMNSVAKSKEMAVKLQTEPVREWVQDWLRDNSGGQPVKNYALEHLDASSNVTARDAAKQKLADASEDSPYGIINVGIFGEGTDSPSLNAVAFLEARKSPIDVIQAVGRAMRTAPDKELGYIICPILIPPDASPEEHLSASNMQEGWQELGQILLALRAHDQRIEDDLEDLLYLYVPSEPEVVRTVVAVANEKSKRISYYEHEGAPGAAQEAVERVVSGKSKPSEEFNRISEPAPQYKPSEGFQRVNEPKPVYKTAEPTTIITGKALPQKQDTSQQGVMQAHAVDADEYIELRMDTVAREKPASDGTPGAVNFKKTKEKARKMINEGAGVRLQPSSQKRRNRRSRDEMDTARGRQMILLSGLQEYGSAIKMNLLSKSGLKSNRVERDLNLLESGVSEAAYHLQSESLTDALNRHFGLDNLKESSRVKQADGCTIAALLMMNAAMLHQRISAGHWMPRINSLSSIKSSANIVRQIIRDWNQIMSHDFRPVFEPALETIYAVENEGKIAGLERALRHITAEAERIAETYADMGADHAGPLFNRVIGNQASDGAYFTRPVAASIAARLTLDACGEQDWTDPTVWLQHKTVDLACGSGTLLTAMLTDMKRRAREQGADDDHLAQLQRLAVEDVVKGMDINPVSLQLAAAQLTAGNKDVRYRKMGLHLMPYGPSPDDPTHVSAGTPELLGQKAIVNRHGELDIPDNVIRSQTVWGHDDDVELEDAVDAAKDARIVIMNPPFTSRANMGEKFPKAIQQGLRSRIDAMEQNLVRNDKDMDGFMDKNTVGPLFVALADRCVDEQSGVLAMINPTIALSAPSGLNERRILAERYQIHTVLTGRWPREFTLSQNTEIDESIILATRSKGNKAPTRFVQLDKMPVDESEVDDLHRSLLECEQGQIANVWGEISYWPAELIASGDWTPAIWRSPELAEGAAYFANHKQLIGIGESGLSPAATGRTLRGSFEPAESGTPGSFAILKSKSGIHGQKTIRSRPDDHWIPKNRDDERRRLNGGTYPEVKQILQKAGHLLITAGHDSKTGRLTATADNECYVGNGWMPVPGLPPTEAKAAAVFINSTAGRLQLMRHAGRKIPFPTYSAAEAANLRIPDIKNDRIRSILSDCWESTKDIEVPQFRDGECEVRRLWDAAVAEAMDWDAAELERLRLLLHQEPHVRGLGYGQYADEAGEEEQFLELLSEWREETAFQSSPRVITSHPAYQQIIDIGKPVLPFIFEDMQENGGWWYPALRAITGDNPVPKDARGNRTLNDEAWLRWAREHGYA